MPKNNPTERFLVFYEFGSIYSIDGPLPESIKVAVDHGYCDVIDITHNYTPKMLSEGEWIGIPSLNSEFSGERNQSTCG